MIRKLGYLPDKPDTRDFDAEEKLGAAVPPPSADLTPYVVDVLDQGPLNSCVANAILQAVRMSHSRQGVVNPPLGSRLFGYYLSRAVDHSTMVDEGTYLRSFFSALAKFGFCPEAAFPYDTGGDAYKVKPPADAFRLAYDQRSPTSYHRITSNGYQRITDIKRAIAAGYAVCFGTDVSESFCRNELGSTPLVPPTAEPIAGGHAMALVGYNGDAFNDLNSWGINWGAGGYCTLSADYLVWDRTRDLWIVEAVPPIPGAA